MSGITKFISKDVLATTFMETMKKALEGDKKNEFWKELEASIRKLRGPNATPQTFVDAFVKAAMLPRYGVTSTRGYEWHEAGRVFTKLIEHAEIQRLGKVGDASRRRIIVTSKVSNALGELFNKKNAEYHEVQKGLFAAIEAFSTFVYKQRPSYEYILAPPRNLIVVPVVTPAFITSRLRYLVHPKDYTKIHSDLLFGDGLIYDSVKADHVALAAMMSVVHERFLRASPDKTTGAIFMYPDRQELVWCNDFTEENVRKRFKGVKDAGMEDIVAYLTELRRRTPLMRLSDFHLFDDPAYNEAATEVYWDLASKAVRGVSLDGLRAGVPVPTDFKDVVAAPWYVFMDVMLDHIEVLIKELPPGNELVKLLKLVYGYHANIKPWTRPSQATTPKAGGGLFDGVKSKLKNINPFSKKKSSPEAPSKPSQGVFKTEGSKNKEIAKNQALELKKAVLDAHVQLQKFIIAYLDGRMEASPNLDVSPPKPETPSAPEIPELQGTQDMSGAPGTMDVQGTPMALMTPEMSEAQVGTPEVSERGSSVPDMSGALVTTGTQDVQRTSKAPEISGSLMTTGTQEVQGTSDGPEMSGALVTTGNQDVQGTSEGPDMSRAIVTKAGGGGVDVRTHLKCIFSLNEVFSRSANITDYVEYDSLEWRLKRNSEIRSRIEKEFKKVKELPMGMGFREPNRIFLNIASRVSYELYVSLDQIESDRTMNVYNDYVTFLKKIHKDYGHNKGGIWAKNVAPELQGLSNALDDIASITFPENTSTEFLDQLRIEVDKLAEEKRRLNQLLTEADVKKVESLNEQERVLTADFNAKMQKKIEEELERLNELKEASLKMAMLEGQLDAVKVDRDEKEKKTGELEKRLAGVMDEAEKRNKELEEKTVMLENILKEKAQKEVEIEKFTKDIEEVKAQKDLEIQKLTVEKDALAADNLKERSRLEGKLAELEAKKDKDIEQLTKEKEAVKQQSIEDVTQMEKQVEQYKSDIEQLKADMEQALKDKEEQAETEKNEAIARVHAEAVAQASEEANKLDEQIHTLKKVLEAFGEEDPEEIKKKLEGITERVQDETIMASVLSAKNIAAKLEDNKRKLDDVIQELDNVMREKDDISAEVTKKERDIADKEALITDYEKMINREQELTQSQKEELETTRNELVKQKDELEKLTLKLQEADTKIEEDTNLVHELKQQIEDLSSDDPVKVLQRELEKVQLKLPHTDKLFVDEVITELGEGVTHAFWKNHIQPILNNPSDGEHTSVIAKILDKAKNTKDEQTKAMLHAVANFVHKNTNDDTFDMSKFLDENNGADLNVLLDQSKTMTDKQKNELRTKLRNFKVGYIGKETYDGLVSLVKTASLDPETRRKLLMRMGHHMINDNEKMRIEKEVASLNLTSSPPKVSTPDRQKEIKPSHASPESRRSTQENTHGTLPVKNTPKPQDDKTTPDRGIEETKRKQRSQKMIESLPPVKGPLSNDKQPPAFEEETPPVSPDNLPIDGRSSIKRNNGKPNDRPSTTITETMSPKKVPTPDRDEGNQERKPLKGLLSNGKQPTTFKEDRDTPSVSPDRQQKNRKPTADSMSLEKVPTPNREEEKLSKIERKLGSLPPLKGHLPNSKIQQPPTSPVDLSVNDESRPSSINRNNRKHDVEQLSTTNIDMSDKQRTQHEPQNLTTNIDTSKGILDQLQKHIKNLPHIQIKDEEKEKNNVRDLWKTLTDNQKRVLGGGGASVPPTEIPVQLLDLLVKLRALNSSAPMLFLVPSNTAEVEALKALGLLSLGTMDELTNRLMVLAYVFENNNSSETMEADELNKYLSGTAEKVWTIDDSKRLRTYREDIKDLITVIPPNVGVILKESRHIASVLRPFARRGMLVNETATLQHWRTLVMNLIWTGDVNTLNFIAWMMDQADKVLDDVDKDFDTSNINILRAIAKTSDTIRYFAEKGIVNESFASKLDFSVDNLVCYINVTDTDVMKSWVWNKVNHIEGTQCIIEKEKKVNRRNHAKFAVLQDNDNKSDKLKIRVDENNTGKIKYITLPSK